MTTVFVGTTRWRGASRPGIGGLYRLDGGSGTWELVPDVPRAGVQAIVVDQRTGAMYAGTGAGVYRSDDSGKTWQQSGVGSEDQSIWSIFPQAARPGTLFAGVGPRAILRSDDDGQTWRHAALAKSAQIFNIADDGVTLLPFSARVTGLATEASRPELVYAAVEVEGILRSEDGGSTWQDCSRELLALAGARHLAAKIGVMDGRKSMADGHAIIAYAGSVFYANRLGLFRSDDCGNSWNDVRLDCVSPLTYVRSIVVSPVDPNTFYAALSVRSGGNDGTIWRSRDAGITWARFDHGISADSTIMAVAAHPTDADVVYAVSYSGQVFGTEDGGRTWRNYRLPDGSTECYAVASI